MSAHSGGIAAGSTDQQHLISTGLDILPTICDYAGDQKPAHLLGESLRPIAEGKDVDVWRSYVASENHYGRMIRSDRYKYSAYDSSDSKEALVDLENDPGEIRNLVDDPKYQDTLLEHRRLLAEWSKLSGDKDASKYLRNG
jgi:arylsulfatase A-like enzyme